MTTPSQPGSGSRLLGTNDLQSAIDRFSTAVDKLSTVAAQMGSTSPGGTTTTAFGSTGQSFTRGSFPRMTSAASYFNGAMNATTGGPGGPPSGGTNNPATTLPAAMGSLGSQFSAMAPSGSQFSTQITMNQYAAMSMLGMSPGTNVGAGMKAMYNQAFGSYGSNLNAIATSPADAAQMYSNLQGIAASPNVMSTAQGRAGYGASAGFGIANPALGGAGSSAAAAQLYSGQTSLAMRQLGYGATPRAGLGQQNPLQMGQVMQTMMQRWYGKSSVSQGTLNAGLANNGRIQLNLQALGLDPSTMGPALQMYNKLFSQGVSATSAQTMLNDAAHNASYGSQGSAQKLLADKYKIPTSDLQKLKDTTAQQTSTTSGEMGGFDSAISQATTTVQKFDSVLNDILKVTGLGTVLGASHGFSGAMNAVGGTVGSLIGKGVGMLSRFGGAGGSVGGVVSGGSNGSKPGSSTSNVPRSVQTAIKDAEQQLGKPYVWGGDNPQVGFDCSGLVEWAYGQAGIKLPRTSQEQWAALSNRSVSPGKVQAGDIVFSAGSDGTATSPGHEAMMISNKQIIEAPYTGASIRVRAYNPSEWQHAARPTGSMTNVSTSGGTSNSLANGTSSTVTGAKGNGGLGLAPGAYGSSSELQNVAAALLGGGLSGGSGGGTFASTATGNGQGSAAGTPSVSTAGGGSNSANQALAKKMAASMYGWTGSQWTAGLLPLWTQESGFNAKAQNPTSTAFGIAQFLNSTWGPYGPKTSNPGLQIKYGLEYIHDRYGNPVGAEAHEKAYNWYGTGTGSALGGLALVGDRGPELVRLSGGQQIHDAKQTSDMLKGTAARPSQAPWSTGTAQQLMLANMPQNQAVQAGKCEVNLHMPQGAIVVNTTGSTSDVSNSVRQIMAGVSQAMADDETLKKIMAGVTS
jgi:cell wall-associated NlpC family hydrolase